MYKNYRDFLKDSDPQGDRFFQDGAEPGHGPAAVAETVPARS